MVLKIYFFYEKTYIEYDILILLVQNDHNVPELERRKAERKQRGKDCQLEG
jgi:hypothetical protein